MAIALFPHVWWLMPGVYSIVGVLIVAYLIWAFYTKHWSFSAVLATIAIVLSVLFIVALALAYNPGNTCTPVAYFIASLGVSASIVFANVEEKFTKFSGEPRDARKNHGI